MLRCNSEYAQLNQLHCLGIKAYAPEGGIAYRRLWVRYNPYTQDAEKLRFRVLLFLFKERRDDTHGRPLQGGAPTVGALGDAGIDENRRAIDLHFPVSWVFN